MIEVLLVDDNVNVIETIKKLLEHEEDILITIANTEIQVKKLLSEKTYTILLVDLVIQGINVFQLCRNLVADTSDTKILLYSELDVACNFNLFVEIGFYGYISKLASNDEVLLCLRAAADGNALLPMTLLRQLRRIDRVEAISEINEQCQLTEKELLMLQEIAKGKKNREIANQHFMTQRNVEYYISRVLKKLNACSRTEAIVTAHKLNLVYHV